MAKKLSIIGLIFYFAFGLCPHSRGQTRLDSTTQLREEIWRLALGEVGMIEPRGRNDNPRILDYHQSVSRGLAKMKPVQPYCASFVWYCYSKAGFKPQKIPNPAAARDWFKVPKRVVMTQQSLRGNRRMMKMPERGDVIGYIFRRGQWVISHVEILDRIDLDMGYLYAIGANTSDRSSSISVNREGEGVYYVRRKIKTFYVISNPLLL